MRVPPADCRLYFPIQGGSISLARVLLDGDYLHGQCPLPEPDGNYIPYLHFIGGTATLPLTVTRSLSQASLATVRRLMSREPSDICPAA